jgi:hypothetical protein
MESLKSSTEILQQNLTCGKWDWTEYESKVERIHGWWVNGIASTVLGLLGILINVVFIRVLTSDSFRKILFNKLIACLTVSDIIFLLCSVHDSIRRHILNLDYCSIRGYIQLIVYPLRKIAMCFSIYMTVVLSLERFLAVTNPIKHRNRQIGRSWFKLFLKYISPAFVVSFFVYGTPLFFAFQMEERLLEGTNINNTSDQSSNSTLGANETHHCLAAWMRLDKMYVMAFNNIGTFLITGAIPFLLLFILNSKIYITIRQASEVQKDLNVSYSGNRMTEKLRQARDRKNERLQSMVLFGIIISFFICHILRVILNLEEMIYFEELSELAIMEKKLGVRCTGVQFWTAIARDISHFLLQVNSSINFLIYGWLSKKFQKAIKENVFGCKNPTRVVFESAQMTQMMSVDLPDETTMASMKENGESVL